MKIISEGAFLARVRRRMAQDGNRLYVSRLSGYVPHRYCELDHRDHCVGAWSCFGELLRAWSDEDSVLAPGEAVAGWESVTSAQNDQAEAA
jgi:hypothetical protein